MRIDHEMIIEDLGCSLSDAKMVCDIMCKEIFHSTLDWQTREQFRQGARDAWDVLELMRPEFEAYYAQAWASFEEAKAHESSKEDVQ